MLLEAIDYCYACVYQKTSEAPAWWKDLLVYGEVKDLKALHKDLQDAHYDSEDT